MRKTGHVSGGTRPNENGPFLHWLQHCVEHPRFDRWCGQNLEHSGSTSRQLLSPRIAFGSTIPLERMTTPRRNILIISLSLALVSTVVALSMEATFPKVFATLEGITYDVRLQLQGRVPTTPALVIVGRDAKSDRDARLGSGAWDRKIFAKIIDALGEAGAKLIASDFYFADSSKDERGGKESDQALIAATRKAANVVYPLPPNHLEPLTDQATGIVSYPFLEQSKNDRSLALNPKSGAVPKEASWSNGFLESLFREAAGIGHIKAESDQDGVYRRVSAFLNHDGQAIPAFAIAVTAKYLQVAPEDISLLPSQALTLRNATLPSGDVRTIEIPLNDRGQFLVNYAGVWDDPPFPYYSFVDVMDAIEDGRHQQLQETFQGKIVFLLHAGAITDKRKTPLELKAPGGFIHANSINTVVEGNLLTEVSVPIQWILTFLASMVAGLSLLGLSPVIGLGVVMGWIGLFCGLTVLLLATGGWVLPVLPPLLGCLLAGGGALTWTAWHKGKTVGVLEGKILADQRELVHAREAVVKQESLVERLEEDLELNRVIVASSDEVNQQLLRNTQDLEVQLRDAQSQLQQSRDEITRLQNHLASLHQAEAPPHKFSEPEIEQLSVECAELGILTRDPILLAQFKDLKKAARGNMPILLLGEPGTGKELFARAVHILSPRASAPFVPMNMAAIPAELFESQLFGHHKGSFSGADRDHKGYFEQAHHGTIFLDEIGDLRLDMQAKMLRVLQDGAFYRVGATSPTKINVRVVAASNRDLAQGVAAGWFREDLYFRLRGIYIVLPPLRERKHDLPFLAERFVRAAAESLQKLEVQLSEGAMKAVVHWRWPGNIRELKQCLEQAVTLIEGRVITEKDLRLEASPTFSQTAKQSESDLVPDLSGDAALLAKLRENGFDMQATAQAVGWDRSTVTQRLKGLCFQSLLDHQFDRSAAAKALARNQVLVRIVELKLNGYYDHLLKVTAEAKNLEEALAIGRKRLKNLPDRHLPAMEALIRHNYKS